MVTCNLHCVFFIPRQDGIYPSIQRTKPFRNRFPCLSAHNDDIAVCVVVVVVVKSRSDGFEELHVGRKSPWQVVALADAVLCCSGDDDGEWGDGFDHVLDWSWELEMELELLLV